MNRENQERMQGNMFEHQTKMQGAKFKQEKDMAYLNAELRGYTTPGAGYGLNAAGGNVTVNNNFTPGDANFTPGSFNAGTSGLGSTQRAQPRMWTSKGSSTQAGTEDGESVNMTGGESTPIQPFEHRTTGAARTGPQMSEADQWLQRNLGGASQRAQMSDVDRAMHDNLSAFQSSPMQSGIKPATRFTPRNFKGGGGLGAAVATSGEAGMATSAGLSELGPEGMAIGLAMDEAESQRKGGAALGAGLKLAGII